MQSLTPRPLKMWPILFLMGALTCSSACGLFGGDEEPPAPEAKADKKADGKDAANKDDKPAPDKVDKYKFPKRVKGLDKPEPKAAKKDKLALNQPKADPKGKTKDKADGPPDKVDKEAPKVLNLKNVLTRNLIKQATQYKHAMRPAPLPGIAPSENYNVIRLQPGRRDNYGVSIQVWKETAAGPQSRRFNELLRQYPQAKRERIVGDSAFVSTWQSVQQTVWLDRKKKTIAVLTCDKAICSNETKNKALAKKVAEGLPSF